ncbi:MAG: hypothetical protein R2865_16145 [Deinococcales bacterium]
MQKALDKELAKRYQSFADFAHELEKLLKGQSLAAQQLNRALLVLSMF